MQQMIHWVEIPCNDIKRAVAFYSSVLAIDMTIHEGMGMKTAFFPHTDAAQSGGCLMQGEQYVPSDQGAVIYLNAGKDLQDALDRVKTAAGKILLPKTSIGENGFMAHIKDTEGNKVGLYSKH